MLYVATPTANVTANSTTISMATQAWPDPCVYGGSGPQHILNLCHAYMALGGARLAIWVGAHGILCRNDITSQTANRCNILKPSYSKTLQVWKRLVVEHFEELNVDVDINELLIKQYAYDYHDYPQKDAF